MAKPILVTPNKIFSDVDPCVVKLDGFSDENISEGIINFLKDIKLQSLDDIQSQSLIIHKWSQEHNYYSLAMRLIGMIKGINN